MFDTTRAPLLKNCKDCLRQAIVVLDWFYRGAWVSRNEPETEATRAQAGQADTVRSELATVAQDAEDPRGRMLVRLIREFAVVRRLGTVVYCRTRRPATVALEILCTDASVAIKRMVKGHLGEGDCKRLIEAAGRVASAPLSFCDARQDVPLTKSVAALAARGYLGVAVVDGYLGPRASEELERVTAEWSVNVVGQCSRSDLIK